MGALTYERFFGLVEKPFSLSSDPRFLYRSPSHAVVFDTLLAGIERREGVLVLTGDIGTGKTTLCRSVLQNLPRKTFSAFVPDPFATREDLLKMLLIDFGVLSVRDLAGGHLKGATRTELSYLLYEFLDSLLPLEAFVIVIVDEAQNLSLSLIEEIRILSDLHGRRNPLQVLFVGQLELRDKLKLPEMRQVDQRVSVHCSLEPLTRETLPGYIAHRLHVAGASTDRIPFEPDALDAIYDASGGVPRLINRICDRTMHRGFLAGSTTLGRALVEAAIRDAGGAELPGAFTMPAASASVVVPTSSQTSTLPAASSPTPSPSPTSSPASTPSPTSTSSPASTPSPTSTSSPTPSPSATSPKSALGDVDAWLTHVEVTPRSTSDGLAAFAAESGVDVLREGREPRWVLGSADGHERRRKWWPPLPEGSSVPAASHRLVRRMARAAAAGVILVGALTGIGAAMSHLPAALDASVISLPAVPWITTPDASAPATNMAESLPAGVVEGPVADEPVKAAVVFSSTTEARSASAPVAGTVTAPVTQPAPAHEHAGATYVVEVALFGSVQRAARLVDELTEKGFRAFQQPLDLGARGSFQQVLLGPFESRSEADGDLERLRQRGRHDDARVAVATKSKAAL